MKKKIKKVSLLELPTPTSISFVWNLGFLLGMILSMQMITGIMLAMNYISSTEEAFNSIIHIMRDIQSGWILRFMHLNGASLFFIFIFLHAGRGMFFNSPKNIPMVWISGVLILLISMLAAFMGYVLPWGQMSYWGATVITSMLTSIPYMGSYLIMWLWGDFSVSQPTLNRMLTLHFLVPFLLVIFILAHLLLLHNSGSANPLGVETNFDKTKFFPYFMVKDTLPLSIALLVLSIWICMNPHDLGDPENFNPASISSTPTHIKPEWYFLFAYAILRCIPSKLGGVLAMVLSIMILMVLIFKNPKINKKFNPIKKFIVFLFFTNFLVLTWMGGKTVNDFTLVMAQVVTTVYFSSFIFM